MHCHGIAQPVLVKRRSEPTRLAAEEECTTEQRRGGNLRKAAIALGMLAAFVVAIQARQAFTPFLVAIAISYTISPLVRFAEARGANRAAAIFTAYVIVTATIGFSLAFVIPPLANQLNEIVSGKAGAGTALNGIAEDWSKRVHFLPKGAAAGLASAAVARAEAYVREIARAAGKAVSSVMSQLASIMLAPVIAFYLTRDVDIISRRFSSWIPSRSRDSVMRMVSDIDQALAGWVRGQVIVCTFVGVATGVSLALLKVEFALPIGFLAGVLEIIPYFGPVFGMVPAVLMAAQRSTVTAVLAAVAFVGIQQVESVIISPRIVGECVGLHPLVVIGALLVGGSLFGVVGILLAVPVTAVIAIMASRLFPGFPVDE
ncbi:MAG: AI-2E family transporter [Clostridia bacterium]|nr:AI-2E family transporter [Clostridia bacterium]